MWLRYQHIIYLSTVFGISVKNPILLMILPVFQRIPSKSVLITEKCIAASIDVKQLKHNQFLPSLFFFDLSFPLFSFPFFFLITGAIFVGNLYTITVTSCAHHVYLQLTIEFFYNGQGCSY